MFPVTRIFWAICFTVISVNQVQSKNKTNLWLKDDRDYYGLRSEYNAVGSTEYGNNEWEKGSMAEPRPEEDPDELFPGFKQPNATRAKNHIRGNVADPGSEQDTSESFSVFKEPKVTRVKGNIRGNVADPGSEQDTSESFSVFKEPKVTRVKSNIRGELANDFVEEDSSMSRSLPYPLSLKTFNGERIAAGILEEPKSDFYPSDLFPDNKLLPNTRGAKKNKEVKLAKDSDCEDSAMSTPIKYKNPWDVLNKERITAVKLEKDSASEDPAMSTPIKYKNPLDVLNKERITAGKKAQPNSDSYTSFQHSILKQLIATAARNKLKGELEKYLAKYDSSMSKSIEYQQPRNVSSDERFWEGKLVELNSDAYPYDDVQDLKVPSSTKAKNDIRKVAEPNSDSNPSYDYKDFIKTKPTAAKNKIRDDEIYNSGYDNKEPDTYKRTNISKADSGMEYADLLKYLLASERNRNSAYNSDYDNEEPDTHKRPNIPKVMVKYGFTDAREDFLNSDSDYGVIGTHYDIEEPYRYKSFNISKADAKTEYKDALHDFKPISQHGRNSAADDRINNSGYDYEEPDTFKRPNISEADAKTEYKDVLGDLYRDKPISQRGRNSGADDRINNSGYDYEEPDTFKRPNISEADAKTEYKDVLGDPYRDEPIKQRDRNSEEDIPMTYEYRRSLENDI